ncbi:hypothetical protein L1049_001068 [Liquidambar formosana]|uniref:non-specific serine/threonine protein kinase n=1 Tax=Liquidambar formosana TaxID=63359 RepID=A0AAP0N9X8_LIQFO
MATLGISKRPLIPPLLFVLCSFFFLSSRALDTLKPGENLKDNDTLVSSGGVFELGFFSPRGYSSSNHYLGIWLKNDPNKKPVWVANREYPIIGSSGVLTIRYDGNLVITDRRRVPIIVNPGMLAASSNTSVKLFDSGNFVLTEGKMIVWESFYFPSDTFLPGMKLGWFNLATGPIREQFLVSWQSPSNPATGSFSFGLYKNNRTELKVWLGESAASRSIGFWDGKRFKFLYESSLGELNFSYVSNLNEAFLTFNTGTNNGTSWFVITSSAEINEFTMIRQEITMVNYSFCKGSLTVNAAECSKIKPPACQDGDGDRFLEMTGLMPNSSVIIESVQLGLSDCEKMCRNNCSCAAFASFRDDGTECALYYGDKNILLDIATEGNGTIYIRGDFPKKSDQHIEVRKLYLFSDYWRKKRLLLIVLVPVVSLVVPVVVCLMCYLRSKGNEDRLRRSLALFLFQLSTDISSTDEVNGENEVEFGRRKDHELPLLSFSFIATATDNFSAANKLGEGGFGPVYKGMLQGHEIAVKRLSRRSGQGLGEFKNEMLVSGHY